MVSSVVPTRSTLLSGSPTFSTIFTPALGAVLAVAALGCSAAHRTSEPIHADLALLGGRVLTMDIANPHASAVAVTNGRIIAVGSDASIERYLGPKTRIVRLQGRGVTPGLVDAHAHLYGLGASLESLDVRGVASTAEVAALVSRAAAKVPTSEWIAGRGWDQNLWTPPAFPSHDVLDAAAPNHPVSLRRVDGHAVWANQRALSIAGITRETPQPKGGRIVKDENGDPTGVLIDAAMKLVENHIPEPSSETRARRIRKAIAAAIPYGITGVHEMGIAPATKTVYERLARERRLPIRVYAFLSPGENPHKWLTANDPVIGEWFSVRGIKLFADGALGSRGAALLQPYSDDPHNRGHWVMDAKELNTTTKLAVNRGWQVAIHAIGDAASRRVLDVFLATVPDDGDPRHRLEHAQVLSESDIKRLASKHVIASMQPTHATSDMPWAEARLGPQRILGAYAWRAILDAGGRIAFGSDAPVETISPLLGLHAACSRTSEQGTPIGGWYGGQTLTLNEAIRAFTVEPAFASFVEARRGQLRTGYDADITVYDRPLSATGFLETQVDMTIVGGRVIFERK